ncbi:ABC transporter ATP-binding protein [Paenibacillus donghaensis]|uniref:Peptide ABC transporter ATP-binding protein n=1 Tax=Paenibacillus donghaensis TaxID=414771 RepID=A0A2Z2KQ07_9BACL|nr:ABC transporter ATP-binding protein [Paenibacillus donghaensis]ASA25860.1 peptide ABC transporter ATP-binding protein [Paenibacillus donghaensis]
MSVLACEQLTRTYGAGEAKVTALHEVNIEIEAGQFVVFTGPSGSGKSTLLHLLGGLDAPSSGRVLAEGKDLYKLPEKELAVFRRRTFGFVFQSFNLVPVLTAAENILMPLLLDGRKVDPGWLDQLTQMLGIAERLSHLPGQLSGGQQQRVAIARALINRPRIVFADEPTGNLDTVTGNEVLALLKQSVAELGNTLVMITHDPQIACQAGRRISVVDGRLLEEDAQ